MIWRFIDTGEHSGAYNMAVDEVLMFHSPVPVLRVYRWKPHTISIGYAQKMNAEVDPALCQQKGYGFVRRPTGGRAVLHAEELTYSVVGDQTLDMFGDSTLKSYKTIAIGLASSLAELGIEAELQKSKVKESALDANPCFTSAGRYEILVNGKKIVGSAQRRTEGKILQHGSMLIDKAHLDIVDVMPKLSQEGRRRMRKILMDRTTTINDELEHTVRWDELAAAMQSGFEKGLKIELKSDKLTETETKTVEMLVEKYRSDEWNFRRG